MMMCDDVSRIMALVKKVKEVEWAVKRELNRNDYETIYIAANRQVDFVIDYMVFHPPVITRGLKAYQEEVNRACDQEEAPRR